MQDLVELPVYEEQGELPLEPAVSAPFEQPLLPGDSEQ
jgi:hypothetical protein